MLTVCGGRLEQETHNRRCSSSRKHSERHRLGFVSIEIVTREEPFNLQAANKKKTSFQEAWSGDRQQSK